MKRFLTVLLLVIPMAVFGQSNLKFNTTDYSFAQVDSRGYYRWGSWEKCNVRIVINLDKDMVTIYSNVTQYYYICDTYNNGDPYPDTKGGYQIKFYMVDQDGDRGTLRLRVDSNGTSQIYIDFRDCAWCYNVYKVN